MKRDRRAAAMLEYVVAQIRSCRFGPGSRLPPVARLAAQFDLCYATAYRAMDMLVRDRWLVRDSRGRLLVMPTARRRKQELRILLLLNPDETQQTTIHPVWLETFMRLCVKWLRKEPCVVSLAVRDASAETIRAAAAGCGGVVYCGSYDRRLVASPVTLPQVGTGMRGFPDGGCTTVNIDPYKAAAAAVDFFTGQGVREVRVVGFPDPVATQRGAIFECLWRERNDGGRRRHIPERRSCDAGEGGILFTSDRAAVRFWRKRRIHPGLRVSEADVFSMNADCCGRSEDGTVSWAGVAADPAVMAEEVFWEIHNRMLNPDYPVRHILIDARPLENGILSGAAGDMTTAAEDSGQQNTLPDPGGE